MPNQFNIVSIRIKYYLIFRILENTRLKQYVYVDVDRVYEAIIMISIFFWEPWWIINEIQGLR